jgi:hypothetical protein
MKKIFNKPCKNCLFSKDRIVSEERANEIINDCVTNQKFFICHKASMKGENTACNRFFHEHMNDDISKFMIKVGLLEFVEHDK